MQKYYLELSEEGGASHKFYEVIVEENTVRIRYGRIGTDGAIQSQTLASAEEAEKFALKKVQEKKRKGYEDAVQGVRQKRNITRRTIESRPSTSKNAAPLLWRFNSRSPAFGIFVDEKACWVGNQRGEVYKLSHDGEVMVKYQFNEGVKCIVADDRWIYVGCDDGNVYDLSGKLPHRAYEINEDIDIFWLDIKNGLLAVSDSGGNLTTINYEDEEQWRKKSEGVSGWMVRVDKTGLIYYGDTKGVSCYYGHDSSVTVWSRKTESVLFGWLEKDKVYAGTSSGSVYGFSIQGEPDVVCKADNAVFSCATSPNGEFIFAGDNYSSLYCFSASGERLWKLSTGCGSAYSMQYFQTKLYIVTTDGSFACIDVSAEAIEESKQGVVKKANVIALPTSINTFSESAELEAAPQDMKGVILTCVKQGGKLRVQPVSEGYHADWFVQFPKKLRVENMMYIVDEIVESAQGGFYRVLGNIYTYKP